DGVVRAVSDRGFPVSGEHGFADGHFVGEGDGDAFGVVVVCRDLFGLAFDVSAVGACELSGECHCWLSFPVSQFLTAWAASLAVPSLNRVAPRFTFASWSAYMDSNVVRLSLRSNYVVR